MTKGKAAKQRKNEANKAKIAAKKAEHTAGKIGLTPSSKWARGILSEEANDKAVLQGADEVFGQLEAAQSHQEDQKLISELEDEWQDEWQRLMEEDAARDDAAQNDTFDEKDAELEMEEAQRYWEERYKAAIKAEEDPASPCPTFPLDVPYVQAISDVLDFYGPLELQSLVRKLEPYAKYRNAGRSRETGMNLMTLIIESTVSVSRIVRHPPFEVLDGKVGLDMRYAALTSANINRLRNYTGSALDVGQTQYDIRAFLARSSRAVSAARQQTRDDHDAMLKRFWWKHFEAGQLGRYTNTPTPESQDELEARTINAAQNISKGPIYLSVDEAGEGTSSLLQIWKIVYNKKHDQKMSVKGNRESRWAVAVLNQRNHWASQRGKINTVQIISAGIDSFTTDPTFFQWLEETWPWLRFTFTIAISDAGCRRSQTNLPDLTGWWMQMFTSSRNKTRWASFECAKLVDYRDSDEQHQMLLVMRMVLHWLKINATNDMNRGEDTRMLKMVNALRLKGRQVLPKR